MDDVLAPETVSGAAGEHLRKARALYALTRTRRRIFDGSPFLFSDPAWNMALDLFIARAERRVVSVSSAAMAAQCPVTTALRYLAALESRNMIARTASPTDRRIVHVAMTATGAALMVDCLRMFAG